MSRLASSIFRSHSAIAITRARAIQRALMQLVQPRGGRIVAISILLIALTVALAGCALYTSAASPSTSNTSSTAKGAVNQANSATQDYNTAGALGCTHGIPLYLRALTKDRSYTNAYVGLGNCYASLGYFSDAIVQYNKAIAMDPTQYGLYISRAASEYSKGNSGGAIRDLQIAMQSAPPQAPAYASIAAAFDSYADFADAVAAMNKAIGLASANPSFYEQRAQMYLHAQQSRQAYDDYQQAIKIAPSEAYKSSIYVAFANVYLQQQNVDAALRSIQHAIDLQPSDPHLYVASGDIHQQVGRLGAPGHGDGALGLYQHALILVHKGADAIAAHEASGDVLVKLGYASQAIAEYQSAARLTKDPVARARLAAKIKSAPALGS